LPREQSRTSIIPIPTCGLRRHLPSQKRSRLEYGAVRRLFVVNLPDCGIEQRNYVVHPIVQWSRIVDPRRNGCGTHCRTPQGRCAALAANGIWSYQSIRAWVNTIARV
jgi:hypothetical protein